MILLGAIVVFVLLVIAYFAVSGGDKSSDVVEIDIVNEETGEVEQAAAKVEPAVVLTDIKLSNTKLMTLAEVQLIDMSNKPINIKDASVSSSAIHTRWPWPASRLVDGNVSNLMHSAGKNAWAHIKLAKPITLGNLKKIVVWDRPGSVGNQAAGTKIKLYNGDNMLYSWTLQGHHRSYSFDL